MKPEQFSWSAYNPNQWDGDHWAGIQEIYLRKLPRYTTVVEAETTWTRIVAALIDFLGWR